MLLAMISNDDACTRLNIVRWSKGHVREWTDLAGEPDDSWLLSVICSRRTLLCNRTEEEVNIITRKRKRGNVINVFYPLILCVLDVVKKLYVTLNFWLANLLREHIKTTMRSTKCKVRGVPKFKLHHWKVAFFSWTFWLNIIVHH